MSGLNKVILIGNLGKEPEMRYTSQGKAITSFSIATSEQWTDGSGEKQEKTEWHNIVLWDKVAELAKEHLSKGRQVCIEGRIQYRSWEDDDGNKKYITEIVGNKMIFLGKKQE